MEYRVLEVISEWLTAISSESTTTAVSKLRRPLWRRLAVLVSLPALAVSLLAQSASDPPTHIKSADDLKGAIAEVDNLFAEAYAVQKAGSLTVGIVSGSNLVWSKSYGLANIGQNVPATAASTYRIGSITKQFTALMLLQLVDRGKVRLSDPVEKYFPEIKQVRNPYPNAPPITLIQLATHTSGLDREPQNVAAYTNGPVSQWEKMLVAALPHLKYAFEPGTRFSYSNIGYAILGAALGRAAHEPYVEYVQSHILAPLRMTHTAFEPTPEMLTMLAQGHDLQEGHAPDPTEATAKLRTGRGYKVPNGALITNVGDLAKFVSFEMGDGPDAVLPKTVVADNLLSIT